MTKSEIAAAKQPVDSQLAEVKRLLGSIPEQYRSRIAVQVTQLERAHEAAWATVAASASDA